MSEKRKPMVMVVDDNPLNVKIIKRVIAKNDYDITIAMSGEEALEKLADIQPDLILLDVIMPGIDGYEVCQRLKRNKRTHDVPVIFLTAQKDTEDIVKGFRAGGVDYITKPFRIVELAARIKTHIDLQNSKEDLSSYNKQLESINQELRNAYDMIKKKNEQLNDVLEELEKTARTDPLTALPNRRYIMEKLNEEVTQFNRQKKSFSVILGDVDFFKKVNDHYGHDCGDFMLREIARLFRLVIRGQDMVARWGGEEFLFLLPETDQEGVRILAEKLRQKVEDSEFKYKQLDIQTTITFGCATFNLHSDIDSLIINADKALYYGKHSGRNVVISYEDVQHKLNLD